MPDPTLHDFAAALAAVKARWPEAPADLPEHYFWSLRGDYIEYGPSGSDIGDAAALALCVTTTGGLCEYLMTPEQAGGEWWFELYPRPHPAKGWRWSITFPDGERMSGDAPSLPSAALAMLRGIVEGGGE